MSAQIRVQPTLSSLYGMDATQKTAAAAIVAGIAVGVAGFFLVRKLRRKGRR